MSKPLQFFGRHLAFNGSHFHLSMSRSVTVICWEALSQPKRSKKHGDDPPHLWYWHAKIVGVAPDNEFIVVRGRTPWEAMRKLEKATLKAIREFVRVFAVACRQIGTELLQLVHNTDFHKGKKVYTPPKKK